MPRTGGVYSPPAGTKGVSNTTIQSVPYNALVDDLTADANAARPITAGGTGATSASAARTALGAQTASAALTSISALVTSADKLPYTTAADTYAVTTLTAFGRSLIDDADATAARSTLGVVIGTNVQAYDAGLASIAGLTTAADRMIYTTAADAYAVATLTSFARTILDDADATAARATLGVTIGSQVQAYDAGLNSIAGLTTAADRMIYTTAADTYAVATLTSFARTLLDDTSNTAARTTLDVYSKAEVNSLASSSVPAGTVIFYARSTAPSGYLKANGAAVSRTTYADLFAAIGTTFGAGDGSTTFTLPDLRGEFVRGWDDARGADSGRVFGSAQADEIQSHLHTVNPPSTATSSDTHSHTYSGSTNTTGAHVHSVPYQDRGFSGGTINNAESGGATGTFNTGSSGDHSHTYSGTTSSDTHSHTVDIAQFNSGSTGGTETRPRNVALLACIKF
ncbi:tail fiber protein [Sinorhizobium meliloti]|uniref:tail fiber protein n=1 Tax=Rhizobium meliloti TaxID=382 RepID=UPI000FD90FAB|nr:tail fiber protein [Sinorhizobium meliloti]RVH37674.1 tail fiber protein [Sinorhizobium meliloti]